ncbi:hypothetical protein ruthe_02328 [Rubellimicrobium thermophilum DSM 16684]|uniref:Uncharacterized protein n=1 Tax=Rubellimicrobium thermophilum DSM 16684 TaxID=1123069 RepID=S9QWZ8_9RHOB|nr:hypothetical protein [Rubellimicrobium thermophilum]EPX84118.1 hypothetical protein ruthe_02328 [Rubellimicrobium thermophilum DSM 16684]
MFRTIQIGSCSFVQGLYVRDAEAGRIVIRVDGRLYEGWPVERALIRAA